MEAVMSDATPGATELPARHEIEEWFSRNGVPLFSEDYSLKDVELVGAALLTVVAAFEVTVLPWLDRGVGGSLLVLFLLTAVMLPLVPVFRGLLGPSRRTDRRSLIVPTLARGAPLAILVVVVVAQTPRDIRWPGWIDFLVLVTLLLTAALVSRCKRNGAWALAPARQRSALLGGVVASMVLFAVNLDTVPPMTTTLLDSPVRSVSDGLAPPPASLAAFPLATVFLVWAMRLPSGRDGDAMVPGRRSVADYLPILLVVLGIQATILPYLDAPWVITYFVPVALIQILYMAPSLSRWLGSQPVGRWLVRRRGLFVRALRAVAILAFVLGMPILVEITGAGLDAKDALIVNLIYLAGAAIVVGFALDRISEAMAKEAWKSLPSTVAALAQGLPLLLIVLVFLAITTEVWQVSAALDRKHFLYLVGALCVLTVGFAALRSLQDVDHIRRFRGGWRKVPDALANDDSMVAFVKQVASERAAVEHGDELKVALRPSQFLNASFIMSIYQLIFATLVTALMAVAFYVIGKLTIDDGLLETWSVKPHDGGRFADLALLDQPWARVAVLLGLFSGFYFLVQFTTDDDLRGKVLRTPDTALKSRFAVRAAYIEHFELRPVQRGRWARDAAKALARKLRGRAGPRAPL
jgi:hypothetical protein